MSDALTKNILVRNKSKDGSHIDTHRENGRSNLHPHAGFDIENVLHKLKHYLPSQSPLKDFIHHNSLHAYQHMKFYDAIFKASKIFGYQVTLQLTEFRELYKNGRIKEEDLGRAIIKQKGADQLKNWKDKLLTHDYDISNQARIGLLRSNWKTIYKTDLDAQVHPLLFRILCSYLDQGISNWSFPVKKEGFLSSVRELEKNSFASFFKTKKARNLLLLENCGIKELLDLIVGDEAYYEQYLFDQQFCHHGWSGMVSAVEDSPGTLLDRKNISLHELILLELLFEYDALNFYLGNNWEPLGKKVNSSPVNLLADVHLTEINEVFSIWQDAFEWSYYDEVLSAITANGINNNQTTIQKKSFQALFCIDERECSLRRHIENADKNCETFGTPGFFSAEFFFQPQGGKFYDKLCPAPVTPKYLIKEYKVNEKRKHELLYTKQSHSLIAGFFITFTLGILALGKLFLNLFRPVMSPAISNAFTHMNKDSELTIENKNPDDRENDLQIGFTVQEMCDRVESQLRGIALTKDFAPIVYVIAHGSSSANNPHHGAHDCGACSGRPGSVNARVFAFMANHPQVRILLNDRGISIPHETQFAGALHDTASDEIAHYDERHLSEENKKNHQMNVASFEKALDHNAQERSRRFASINSKMDIKNIRNAIRRRSVSLFEPRPELGHGTNTLCIVGRRDLTKSLFLDRRAFMNSYNYQTDPDGRLLSGIMKPLGPVCGGINLEYYFSRVDNYKLGAGTKLPHNVMGLIGVANSCDGDLRPGLPVQMIEVHDPVRLLLIVEHFPDVVLKIIQASPEMYEWFINEWIHLVIINPETGKLSYFNNGSFSDYVPLAKKIETIQDVSALVRSSPEMETNQITDATKENLPVYLLN